MLCERCKIREANIQYTEVINGVKTEHNFCAQCARELDFGPYSAIFDSDFPLGKLLSGLLGIGGEQKEDMVHQVVCPTCKTSYEEFIGNSRFGCPDCYGVFDLLISDNIRQMQGSDSHKGKHPRYHQKMLAAGSVAAFGAPGVPGNSGGVSGVSDGAGIAGESGGAGVPGTSGNVRPEADVREEIQILQARLQDALKKEEYERAAQYRDKIRELKEGMVE